MTRLTAELMTPPAGAVTDASGVAQTAARRGQGDRQCAAEGDRPHPQPESAKAQRPPALPGIPSRVTTSSMITVAKAGVIDQSAPQANSFEASPRTLIARAAATAKINTSPVKMAALLVLVSVLNIVGYFPMMKSFEAYMN